MPIALAPTDLALDFAHALSRRIDAERIFAGAAVACPSAVDDALADVPLIPGELEDDVSRYLTAGAVAAHKRSAEAIIDLTERVMRLDRVPMVSRAAICDVAFSWCPSCIANSRNCSLARTFLPGAARTLAAMIDAEHDAADGLRYIQNRLRGAA